VILLKLQWKVKMIETIEQKYDRYGLQPRLPEVMDHTTSGTFQECFRMGYYRHILNRVPGRTNYALTWGKTVHKLVENWLEMRSLEASFQIINDSIPEIVEDRYGRNRRRMAELFTTWVQFNETNPLEVLRNEQPAVLACLDQPCPYSDTGCGLIYGGRLDRIVNWQGIVGPLDVKTSVIDEKDPVAEYRPSHQMMGYDWLGSHLMGKHQWGVILEKVVCNKSKLYVKRYPVPYAKDLIREWAENEVILQRRIRETFASAPYDMIQWEMIHFRCFKPYRCGFRDICTSSRDMDFRLKFMRDNTVEAPWDFQSPDEHDELLAEAASE
jgi:hypothetical protein